MILMFLVPHEHESAVSTRRRLLGVFAPVLLALTLVVPGVAPAQEVKQIKLTEKQVQGFIAAHPELPIPGMRIFVR